MNVAELFEGVIVKVFTGATATAVGVTALLALDAGDVPCGLVAVTVKVYLVPAVRLVIVQVTVGATAVHEAPPGEAVAV